jgi:hypothetical protein
VSSDVVVEDWLWDDDSPEEPEELELSYEERLLRKRAMWMFVWTLVGMVVLAAIGVVSYRIINEEPTKTLPAACVEGRIEQCPTKGGGTGGGAGSGGGSRSTLPGGFDPATGESKNDGGGDGLTKQQAEARIQKCIQGQVEFCG